MNYVELITIEKSPLELDGWLAWNREMWNLEPQRVVYAPKGKDLPRLEGVIYLDHKGRVRMPPRNPYLPFRFASTGTVRPERLYHQWLEVCGFLADELVKRGIYGTIILTPGFIDGRPFQWRGLEVGVRYTFITRLPVNEQSFAASVRKNIRKAINAGYRVERSRDWEAISLCLKETEQAKSFSHHTNVNALLRCEKLLGNEHFRGYLGLDQNGNIASGGLRLHLPGGTVIDWSQGAVRNKLKSGINQLMYWEVLQDLTQANAAAFDYVGANIPTVSRAKAEWSFPLVPYLTIRSTNFRNIARDIFYFGKSLLGRS